jgi:hypothetical protein
MVDEYRNIMAFMDIFAHLHILRRKRRRIQPEVIQYLLWRIQREQYLSETVQSIMGRKPESIYE